MPVPDCGFRIVGPVCSARRLVMAAATFSGYAACDERFSPDREAYLSAFTFPDAMAAHFNANRGSVAGYAGPCWSQWLWLDIDRTDAATALADTLKLVGRTLERFKGLDDDGPLYFYSGGKGYHFGLPISVFGSPAPSDDFHAVCRRTAETLAANAGVVIDTAVYDRVRPFRAPNSRHPKSSRHKRRLTHSEMFNLTADRHRQLAAEPLPFDVPDPVAADPVAVADWQSATTATAKQSGRTTLAPIGERSLQRDTISFINGTDTPDDGTRNERAFRASANLTEYGTPPAVVTQLLTGPARSAGLTPSEAAKAIASGIAHGRKGVTP